MCLRVTPEAAGRIEILPEADNDPESATSPRTCKAAGWYASLAGVPPKVYGLLIAAHNLSLRR